LWLRRQDQCGRLPGCAANEGRNKSYKKELAAVVRVLRANGWAVDGIEESLLEEPRHISGIIEAGGRSFTRYSKSHSRLPTIEFAVTRINYRKSPPKHSPCNLTLTIRGWNFWWSGEGAGRTFGRCHASFSASF
jgi:hypothetical protein